MELTVAQETDVQKIMAETDCPKDFPCYESGFEDLIAVKPFSGTDVVECLKETDSCCPKSIRFDVNTILCTCPLRRYVSLNLGK